MITYTDVTVVKLEGIPVGMIWANPGGFFYEPLGTKPDTVKYYPTLSLCKASLEPIND